MNRTVQQDCPETFWWEVPNASNNPENQSCVYFYLGLGEQGKWAAN